MDMNFSSEDFEFQKEVRDWISENYPKEMHDRHAKSANGHLTKEDHVYWQKALHSKGWAGLNWPKEYGGPEFTHTQRYLFDLEMAAAGTPGIMPFGQSMVAPVIMKYGTQAQKDKYLPDILASNQWWCQGYSEPGAGSDLASLRTKAERDGDYYVVNGSKTWNTLGQYADMIFCLVRTSDDDIRQMGISFLLIDMTTPGIEVQPIVTIDGPAKGFQEINMVHFNDVRVPVENLIGEEGKGWTYAKYLLEFERGNAYSHGLKAGLTGLKQVAAEEKSGDGRSLSEDPAFQSKIAEAEIAISALEFTELRILSSLSTGKNVGPESSLLKCRGSELQQVLTELYCEAVGNYAAPFDNSGPVKGSNVEPIGPEHAAVAAPAYFNTRKVSIYAGSNEIQRNIMAKMVLGL
ncbi:acyl-CoA dehydrogenase family protein [Pseudomonadales bacterium]|jgi:alkylation response protein AidB-like acyl-CoA dehydrogenase|nr:acyl-CoA dehydrogenase family protein [Pseudomonadales bacterium]|tara:strand:+ start:2699 stop:3913 length:1215 start_codon:yes stop_codon:yes gene_type:complete